MVQTPAWLSHTCAPRHTPEKRGMKQETDGLFPALTSCPVHTTWSNQRTPHGITSVCSEPKDREGERPGDGCLEKKRGCGLSELCTYGANCTAADRTQRAQLRGRNATRALTAQGSRPRLTPDALLPAAFPSIGS